MVDFAARIAAQRAAEAQQNEASAFLRVELDRQLVALGIAFLDFTAAHGLQRWVEVWRHTPEVTWSSKRRGLFGSERVSSVRGESMLALPIKPPYCAYLTKGGHWIYAKSTRFHDPSSASSYSPSGRSLLVGGSAISDLFSVDQGGVLGGGIPEDSDYGDRNHWHLDMTPTGTVGHTVGSTRFSLEQELSWELERLAKGPTG